MYYVYKVEFPSHNAVYIGCTNNIRRRKDQHNGNAANGRGFFGRFLNQSCIKLTVDDFKVIDEFENRHDALVREREEVKSVNGTGVLVLNDNYSDHCSRKGLEGEKNPSSKEYVVVDMQNKTYESVSNVHGWSDSHGAAYKTLIGTAMRKPLVHRGRYILRHMDEWEAMSEDEKERLVSGEWYAQVLRESKEHRMAIQGNTYLVEYPGGEVVKVRNLDRFAREHRINPGNLHATITKGNRAGGYRVIRKVS